MVAVSPLFNVYQTKASPTTITTTAATITSSLVLGRPNASFTPQNFSTVAKLTNDDTPKLDDFLNKKPGNIIEDTDYRVKNLATQLDYDAKTPGRKESMPNMKYLTKTPHDLYTTCYDDAEESFQAISSEDFLRSVLVVQRQWRMKMFRRSLPGLRLKSIQEKIDRAVKAEQMKQEYALKLAKAVVLVVRAYRYKRFRRALDKLRVAERLRQELEMAERHRKIEEAAIRVQKAWRMKRFRRAMVVNRAVEYEKKLRNYAIVVS